MNLHEETNRIKQMMGIYENTFLKRRVSMRELSQAFEEALNYATLQLQSQKSRGQSMSLGSFAGNVISMTIDEIHPQLIADKHEFPYDEVYNFIAIEYQEPIITTYNHHK